MNKTEDKKLIECIYPGDQRIRVFLGQQKLSEAGEYLHKSQFVYSLYWRGAYLLFHTLTRQLLLVAPQLIDYFADDRLFPASILEQELPRKLYEEFFLVPENVSESQIYLELKALIVVKEELPQGISKYIILPTTTCNARCFYCFERGMQYQKMNPETVENTIQFILRHRPKDNKKIHIHWFGGEPMCATDNIDRICSGLIKEGVEYTAEMTSNGSLFTEELAKRAAETWKVRKIQITLDGMAEEYAKRKCFSSTVKNPFQTVVRNIHLLIATGIHVIVRLNVDENNLGEIYRVVDFLKEEFDEEEKKKLSIYAHSIYGQSGEGIEACSADVGSDMLEARVLEMNDYIQRRMGITRDPGKLYRLKSHYCMVAAPECSVVIDAAGRLNACENMPENLCYGDVKADIDPEIWNRVSAPCNIQKECDCCVFLPQCTEFDRCPNRVSYDSCYRQEMRNLDWELRYAYGVYQDQKKKKQE